MSIRAFYKHRPFRKSHDDALNANSTQGMNVSTRFPTPANDLGFCDCVPIVHFRIRKARARGRTAVEASQMAKDASDFDRMESLFYISYKLLAFTIYVVVMLQ
jgi:hypothetical protein